MSLIYLERRPGVVHVQLPDGTTRWVGVADLIALEKSYEKPAPSVEKTVIGKTEPKPKKS